MSQPLVSVLIITYNHAAYIAQAIEGVVQQRTRFPIELVIGEDCSTDGTREIVLDYQKKYPQTIRVITSDRNVGGHENVKRTREACRGKYMALCEGDDYWHHPDKLQKQVDYFESHPECGLVFTDFDVYFVKENKLVKNYIKSNKWKMPEVIDVAGYVEGKNGLKGIATCTVMLRKNILEKILQSDPYLHDNSYFQRNDSQLWAEFIHHTQIYYIEESMATYRKLRESASNISDVKKRMQFEIRGAELMLYLCDKYNLSERIRRTFENNRLSLMLRLAFHLRDASMADEVYKTKKPFTGKEWLWYIGSKNAVIHHISQIARSCRRLIKIDSE